MMPDVTLLLYAVTQLDIVHYVKWAILIVFTLALIYMLGKQNRQHAALVNDGVKNPTTIALFYLARTRGMVVLLLWVLVCTFLIYRDIETEINNVRAPSHDIAITPSPPVITEHVANEYGNETSESLNTPSPEKQLDIIKASYEDAFVSYLILDGCKKANLRDYESIYLALLEALKPFDATGVMAGNIIIAASGSYQGLYRGAPCEASYLTPVEQNLQQFIQNIRRN